MAPLTRRRSRLARKQITLKESPKDRMIELTPKDNKECMFCGRKEIDERLYGQLYQLNDIIVHYFCILLSSRAMQNGADNEGIWGFLLKDIKNEIARGSKETCVYCKRKGATIACCSAKCKKTFHLPCGLKNGSMHQFFQTFKSFCQQHRITQTVDLNVLQKSDPQQCSICKEEVTPAPIHSSLWAPCCKRNAWFHRSCIQNLALTAGYFFRCPLCNNQEIFKYRMLILGIYVPSRDAAWETVPNAFADLLERHNTCNVLPCKSSHPEKEHFSQDSGLWEIVICRTCASNGTHRMCSGLSSEIKIWYCDPCRTVKENEAKRRRLENGHAIIVRSNESERHEQSNDVPTNRNGLIYRNFQRNGYSRNRRLHLRRDPSIVASSIPVAKSPTIDNSVIVIDSDDEEYVEKSVIYIEPSPAYAGQNAQKPLIPSQPSGPPQHPGPSQLSELSQLPGPSQSPGPSQLLRPSYQTQGPKINSYKSMNGTGATVINNFCYTFSNQFEAKCNNVSLAESIDLTSDKDDYGTCRVVRVTPPKI